MRIIKSMAILLLAASLASACKGGGEAAQNQVNTGDFNVTVLSEKHTKDGVRELSVRPSGVCSTQIDIAVKDDIIQSVSFTNGCPGNTQGVAVLVQGMTIDEAIAKLEGIDCAGKGTSCPDQLTRALKELKR